AGGGAGASNDGRRGGPHAPDRIPARLARGAQRGGRGRAAPSRAAALPSRRGGLPRAEPSRGRPCAGEPRPSRGGLRVPRVVGRAGGGGRTAASWGCEVIEAGQVRSRAGIRER